MKILKVNKPLIKRNQFDQQLKKFIYKQKRLDTLAMRKIEKLSYCIANNDILCNDELQFKLRKLCKRFSKHSKRFSSKS